MYGTKKTLRIMLFINNIGTTLVDWLQMPKEITLRKPLGKNTEDSKVLWQNVKKLINLKGTTK